MSARPDPHAAAAQDGGASDRTQARRRGEDRTARPAPRPQAQAQARPGQAAQTPPTATPQQDEPRRHLPRLRIEAFLDDEETASAFDATARDRRAARAELVRHPGSFGEAIAHYAQNTAPDVIVIGFDGPPATLVTAIDRLAELCPAETRLLVIGGNNDVALYRRLMQIGVSDYLLRPVDPLVLLDAIADIDAEEEDAVRGRVLAFLGARGGVGASTLAHNTAHCLADSRAATTMLIDMVAGFGTAALQFDLTLDRGLAEAFGEGETLDGEVLDRLVHWRDKRFGLLAAAPTPDAPAAPEGQVTHVIDQARRMCRNVVLDLPCHWQPWTPEALQIADTVVLVAGPDLVSLRNLRLQLAMLGKLRPNDDAPVLVLNAVPSRPKPAIGAREFARTLELEPAALIPADPAPLAAAELAGEILLERSPRAPSARAIRDLAHTLCSGAQRGDAGATRGRAKAAGRKAGGGFLAGLFGGG